ncbi:hypothetical protein OUZ56_016015 [Daphnia magna]|uniref:Uncharacterized protein n=1 Tax=Daphnia magna TaxID=35525 RepID=A0ABR0APK8_9CRUS|nr:hypothetical protein OUZ56_016015 [Daphnia magna]
MGELRNWFRFELKTSASSQFTSCAFNILVNLKLMSQKSLDVRDASKNAANNIVRIDSEQEVILIACYLRSSLTNSEHTVAFSSVPATNNCYDHLLCSRDERLLTEVSVECAPM